MTANLDPAKIKKIAKEKFILRYKVNIGIVSIFIAFFLIAVFFYYHFGFFPDAGSQDRLYEINPYLPAAMRSLGFICMVCFIIYFFRLENKIIRVPHLFCPKCEKYITESYSWTCPYCDNLNDYSSYFNLKMFSIYAPCRVCKREAALLQCPRCKEPILVGEANNDGKYINLEKNREPLIIIEEWAERTITSIGRLIHILATSEEDLKKEEELKEAKKGKTKEIPAPTFQAQKESREQELELKRLELEQTKIEAEIDALKKGPKSELEKYEERKKLELARKRIDKEVANKQLELDIISLSSFIKTKDQMIKKILAGENLEGLSEDEKKRRQEEIEDVVNQCFDRMG
jgi:hypothetical protein